MSLFVGTFWCSHFARGTWWSWKIGKGILTKWIHFNHGTCWLFLLLFVVTKSKKYFTRAGKSGSHSCCYLRRLTIHIFCKILYQKLSKFFHNLGPTALAAHGIGVGKALTSYPSVKDKFKGFNIFHSDSCLEWHYCPNIDTIQVYLEVCKE